MVSTGPYSVKGHESPALRKMISIESMRYDECTTLDRYTTSKSVYQGNLIQKILADLPHSTHLLRLAVEAIPLPWLSFSAG